jgi:hypothetical protein
VEALPEASESSAPWRILRLGWYDTDMNLGWLENLTRPLSSIATPLAQRVGKWLGRRKPRLYVHFNPTQTLWCLAEQRQPNGTTVEMMQMMFWADFNHDDERQTLILTDAYPEGTSPQMGMISKFAIPPGTMVNEQVAAFVAPVKGLRGSPWEGRFVLVDQFQRKYKTNKVTFRWAGPVAPSPR